ncbi:MAG: hypothetical protein ACE5KE_15815 [Methanosarcinales archaeon]
MEILNEVIKIPEYVTQEVLEKEIIRLKKEIQEFKARHEEIINAINERDKLIDRFWKERIAYLSIIVALLVALITLYLR